MRYWVCRVETEWAGVRYGSQYVVHNDFLASLGEHAHAWARRIEEAVVDKLVRQYGIPPGKPYWELLEPWAGEPE